MQTLKFAPVRGRSVGPGHGTGPERRRRWSKAEKIDLGSCAFAPDAVVKQVARGADVHPSQLYRWRAELRRYNRLSGQPGFNTSLRQRQHCLSAIRHPLVQVEFGVVKRHSFR